MIKDKILGCWMGKSIGGTIGAPMEGKMEWLDLPLEYPKVTVENDDLDLQLVWLHVMEQHGLNISAQELSQGWQECITYPWDEYGVALANLKMGITPPQSGYYNNFFINGMGSPIRSEIWACIFPGKPEVAGWFASQDAQVDHWDAGIYGEVLFSCMQSMAFDCSDIEEITFKALQFIPENNEVGKVSRLAFELHKKNKTLKESRDIILEKFGNPNFTHCIQNIGFTLLGLLYGQGDLLKTIIYAANCGYDTDCTAATAGALIGIIQGGKKILSENGTEASKEIIAGWGIKNCCPPDDVVELTERVYALTKRNSEAATDKFITHNFELPHVNKTKQTPVSLKMQIKYSTGKISEQEPQDLHNSTIINSADSYLPLKEIFNESESDKLILQTYFHIPSSRCMNVLSIFENEQKVWLDGQVVLQQKRGRPFCPSPHRCSIDSKLLKVKEGWHRVTVELKKPQDDNNYTYAFILACKKHHIITDAEFSSKPVELAVK